MTSRISVDGTNCILLPGLIDANVGVGADPQAFKRFASLGVTAVIDSGSDSSSARLMREAAASDPTAPAYLATGSAVGLDQSDMSNLSPYRDSQSGMTPSEAGSIVTQRVSDGADFIKIIADQPGLRSETIAAAVVRAHQLGKKVIAHASQLQCYRTVVGLGVDCITPVPIDGTLDAATIRLIVEKGIGVVPTLSFLRTRIGSETRHHSNPARIFSSAQDAVKSLYDAGAKICAGSAANSVSGMAVPAGQGMLEELRELARVGLSSVDVIRAATAVPAEVFGLSDRGTIAVGRVADLLLVEGESFEDFLVDGRIRKVWVRGVEI